MKNPFKKYIPFFLTDLRASRRIVWLFEMIFWPLISLISFGIFMNFAQVSMQVKTLLFTGIIGWTTINVCQSAISRGFMHEVWDRTLRQTFSSPIKFIDFILGHWLYGIFQITVSFAVLTLMALFFFNFNLFEIGLYIPLIFGLIAMSALIIGTIAVSFVLLLGLKVDFLIWSLVDMIVVFSGIYYSVTVFPQPIQFASHLFPVIYVFESMRNTLAGINTAQTIFQGYWVAFIWVLIVLMLVRKIETYARKTGFYQKYG